MSRFSLTSDHLFIPALVLSVSAHVLLLAGSTRITSSADFSVLHAPNSPEFTVVSQPQVSIIEQEIVTEEIIDQNIGDTVVLQIPVNNTTRKDLSRKAISSQESNGSIRVAKPLMRTNHAPAYPKIARQKGWEGTVRLNVYVEKDGSTRHVGIYESSGHSALDRAAQQTVKRWKFQPARSGNVRFSSKIIIPIQFDLVDSW